jgi:hypothetical protein
MESVLFIVMGLYLTIVGIRGNASALFNQVLTEKEFIYWIVAIVVVLALWETPVGEEVAKPLAGLLVLGFLVSNTTGTGRNYVLIGHGISQVLGASTTSTTGAVK